MLTIPVWSLPLLLTLLTVGLGFLWRLGVRAERLADKLEAQVERMTALETRLAAVNALETAVTQIRADLAHERELRGRLEASLASVQQEIKDARHKASNDLQEHVLAYHAERQSSHPPGPAPKGRR